MPASHRCPMTDNFPVAWKSEMPSRFSVRRWHSLIIYKLLFTCTVSCICGHSVGVKETWICFTWRHFLHLWLHISVVGHQPTNSVEVNKLECSGTNLAFRHCGLSDFYTRWLKKNKLAFLVPTLSWKNKHRNSTRSTMAQQRRSCKKTFPLFSEASKKHKTEPRVRSAPSGSCSSLLEVSHPWPCPASRGCITNKKKGKLRGWALWQGFGNPAPQTSWDSG